MKSGDIVKFSEIEKCPTVVVFSSTGGLCQKGRYYVISYPNKDPLTGLYGVREVKPVINGKGYYKSMICFSMDPDDLCEVIAA